MLAEDETPSGHRAGQALPNTTTLKHLHSGPRSPPSNNYATQAVSLLLASNRSSARARW